MNIARETIKQMYLKVRTLDRLYIKADEALRKGDIAGYKGVMAKYKRVQQSRIVRVK